MGVGISRKRVLAEIELVYRTRYAAFARVATAITGDEQAGHDAVHDGFVGAVQGVGGFRGDAPVESWLWRAVVNAALRRRDARPGGAVAYSEPEAPAEPERDAAVRSAVERLPERQRLVLFLRYFADLDYAAIGRIAGISPGTVGATPHAAHAVLRDTLVKEVRS